MSKVAILTLAALLTGSQRPALAQESGPRGWAFGFSAVGYLIEETDGVFTDADEHMTPNFGFRFTKAWFGNRHFGWMLDSELYLGVAHRMLIDVDLPETIFGLQAFAGPAIAFGPFQTYAAVGVNRTTIGGSKIVEAPISSFDAWTLAGGVSETWIAIVNQLVANAGPNDVIASIPAYSDVSLAGLLGIAWDFGPRGFGGRFSIDYIPVFMSPTRNNIRFSLSLAG